MNTLHILSSSSSPVHIDNRIDPFSIAVIKFVENMQKLGWNCIHYGIAGCDVPCETIVCLPNVYNDARENLKVYNTNAGIEIAKRKQAGDLIMCFHGHENQAATIPNTDLIIVEPSIGYETSAIFAPYRVFVSQAQMHMFYGERKMLMNPSWFDAVIPNAFTPSEFEYSIKKKDYVLYFGRVIENKGIHIAIQATAKSGHKLIIAGPGNLADLGYNEIPEHVTCVGLVNAEQRKELMRDARAIIGPTYYVEPFGNMVVEGYFSGTPAITSDWGGFTETVVHGVTGFRCREFNDFVNALTSLWQIDPAVCRNWAWSNYEETVVHKQFDRYFKKLQSKDFYGGNKV